MTHDAKKELDEYVKNGMARAAEIMKQNTAEGAGARLVAMMGNTLNLWCDLERQKGLPVQEAMKGYAAAIGTLTACIVSEFAEPGMETGANKALCKLIEAEATSRLEVGIKSRAMFEKARKDAPPVN